MDNWGISKGAVAVEQPIHSDVEIRPTFSAQTGDFHLLCIEVSGTAYANHLDACVVSCIRHGLAVKLYVAMPKGLKDPNFEQNIRAAKRAGVGLIEIDGASGTIIQNAQSLSVNMVRPIQVIQFPKKYRHNLMHAEQTFRDGTPEKACALIYDEIESLFRKVATKTHSKGWWANSNGWNIDTFAWARVIDDWSRHLDRGNCPCPSFTPAFAARLHGITTYRNESGHKPKDYKALIKRDQQLRTRFENAVDLFKELVEASKPLKV
jgi:hypothetical protein